MEYILMDQDGINCLVSQIGFQLGDSFVIADECVEALEQLVTQLKNEDKRSFKVSRMLGLLEVLENTLIPMVIHLSGEEHEEADTIFHLTCTLMMHLTLPLESGADEANDLRKYQVNFKRAAIDSSYLHAFLTLIKILIKQIELDSDDKSSSRDTVCNGLLYIRNMLLIKRRADGDISQRYDDIGLLQLLFQAGLGEIIITLGKSESHFYIHSALLQTISLLYREEFVAHTDLDENSLHNSGAVNSTDLIVSPRQMSNYVSEGAPCSVLPTEGSPQRTPLPLSQDTEPPICLRDQHNETTAPQDDRAVTENVPQANAPCENHSTDTPANVNPMEAVQGNEEEMNQEEGETPREEREKEDQDNCMDITVRSHCSRGESMQVVRSLTARIRHFESRLCLSYKELEVRQHLATLLESILRDQVFNNLVKGLVTTYITCEKFALPDLYLSWFISYFLQSAKKLQLNPVYVRSCLSIEVVSYLTHVGVITCEEIVANRLHGCMDNVVYCRNYLATDALSSVLSYLQYYWGKALSPQEEKFLIQLTSLIVQLKDLRFLLYMCIRHYDPCHQSVAYLRNLIITNHTYFVVAEHAVHFENIPKFNMLSHIKHYASADIMGKYGLLLEDYPNESPSTIDCIFTMMHHVAGECESPQALLQLPILQTFLSLLDSDVGLKKESYDLITFLIHNFLNMAEKDPFTCATTVFKYPEDEETEYLQTLDVDPSTASLCSGDTIYSWNQGELDELFASYQSFSDQPLEAQLRKITEELSEKDIYKTEKEVYFQLIKEGLITENDQNPGIEGFSIPVSRRSEEKMDMSYDEPADSNWWHGLIETLRSRGDGQRLRWLQGLLLEVCYVKIGGRNIGKLHEPEEPVALHHVIQNKPVPLVPYLVEDEKILDDFIFRIMLEKFGLLRPHDSKQAYPRIPAHWSPEELIATAKLLGPIDFNELKFNETDVTESVFKINMTPNATEVTNTPEQVPEKSRPNGQMSSLWHVFVQQCNITLRNNLRDIVA